MNPLPRASLLPPGRLNAVNKVLFPPVGITVRKKKVITHHRLKVVEKREHTLFCADQFFGRKFSADHFFGRNDANIWHAPFAEIFLVPNDLNPQLRSSYYCRIRFFSRRNSLRQSPGGPFCKKKGEKRPSHMLLSSTEKILHFREARRNAECETLALEGRKQRNNFLAFREMWKFGLNPSESGSSEGATKWSWRWSIASEQLAMQQRLRVHALRSCSMRYVQCRLAAVVEAEATST